MKTIDVIDRTTGEIAAREIPLGDGAAEYTVDLETVPGANALHVLVRDGADLLLSAAVTAEGGDTMAVRLHADRNGRIHVDSSNREVTYLPCTPDPAGTLIRSAGRKRVEFVFLIDATMLAPDPATGAELRGVSNLLGTPPWEELTARLCLLGDELRRHYPDGARAAVIAFGDAPMPPVSESGFTVYPGDAELRRLREYRRDAVASALRGLPAAGGGDFIDALAEGLAACRQVGWRDDTRKLVILVGDSPGYSMLEAHAPQGKLARLLELADARVRDADVFEEAEALRALGVEVISIYNTAPLDLLQPYQPDLLLFARKQYARLASKPEWMWALDALDPEETAGTWHREAGVLGSGACPGFWVE